MVEERSSIIEVLVLPFTRKRTGGAGGGGAGGAGRAGEDREVLGLGVVASSASSYTACCYCYHH